MIQVIQPKNETLLDGLYYICKKKLKIILENSQFFAQSDLNKI